MPVVYRLIKQLLYGAFYLVLLGILVVSLAIPLRRLIVPAGPSPTPQPLPERLLIEQATAVRHGSTVDLVARLRNPNLEFGIQSVTGTFRLLTNDGREISRHPVTTYLLPGTLQYLVALDVPVNQPFTHLDVSLDQPQTAVIPKTLTLPTFATFLRERTRFTSGAREIEQQTGILRNTSSLDWERIEIIGLALDERGVIIGVSRTFLDALASGSQLEFTLQWPAPARSTHRVVLWPTTNIFEETNIIKVIGDPASLR